jgi:hypothetical protein
VCNTHHPKLLAPFAKWKNKFTWGKTRGVLMYCISSASERKHEIACTSWSSCLWKLCELVSKCWRTALHRFYIYRNTYFISRDSKMCTFEVLLFCVWCLDNLSQILSGKPFNTISMARLKTLQFHLILTPLFTATHTLFVLSSTIFFHDMCLGYLVYSRVTLDLWLILIHRDLWNYQKCLILIYVNRDLDFVLLT